MNLSEFKAWFEGFTESMDGPPGEKAWKRIQDRIKSIKSDEPTARHVFHEYYERPWHRWYTKVEPGWVVPLMQSGQIAMQNGYAGGASNLVNSNAVQSLAAPNIQMQGVSSASVNFDPQEAFNRLGRAEALSLKK